MKVYSFKEKLPELGSNIFVIHEEGKMIGICEFDLAARKSVISESDPGYYPQTYYSDDATEEHEYDLRCSDFWFYPSFVKIPKKKKA
jgi:hypothetical protein